MPEKRSRHGLRALMARVKVSTLARIDKRTAGAQGLIAWRRELLSALGGAEHVSPQKVAIVDLCVRTKLYVDHLDAFLMGRESLVNKKTRSIIPALRERQQLADSLARLLTQLGLERVAPAVEDLQTVMASIEAARGSKTVDGEAADAAGATSHSGGGEGANADAGEPYFSDEDDQKTP
jgi:hypothetical protein